MPLWSTSLVAGWLSTPTLTLLLLVVSQAMGETGTSRSYAAFVEPRFPSSWCGRGVDKRRFQIGWSSAGKKDR
ncbi:hypothetical protein LZ31DRAFT_556416 [Colletotrichum somersetense]|nr:hypothetical protein LZ31DRAFT_556416 [Colletotrichum somersetense]